MICDPRFVVKSPLIYKIAENVLLASAVNYGWRFTALLLSKMPEEREKWSQDVEKGVLL